MSKEREAEKALPERWSARVKSDVVLRLFRGANRLDPATLVMAALLLGMTALLASYLPALRATRIDSLRALRYE